CLPTHPLLSLSIVREPPPLPLLPCTSLFRSGPCSTRTSPHFRPSPPSRSARLPVAIWSPNASPAPISCPPRPRRRPDGRRRRSRSEEHTSELQSRENLVCRLLLAKNKFPVLG